MNNLLNDKDLIGLHDELNEFAKYHHNKGGQEAHRLIKKAFLDSMMEHQVRDGSAIGIAEHNAKEELLRGILSLLHETFVP